MKNIKLTMIDEAGPHLQGYVNASFEELKAVLGEPNVEDDPDKVEASWGFTAEGHRPAFVWSWKCSAVSCRQWSAAGDFSLLEKLFPGKVKKGW